MTRARLGAVVRRYWKRALLLAGLSAGAFYARTTIQGLTVGFGALIVSVAGLIWQVWRARYNQSIDLVLKLSAQFDGPKMLAARSEAAKALRKIPGANENAIDEVLDFWEQVGFLLRRRALDIETIYEFFEYWAVPYCQLTTGYRIEERHDCSGRYSDVYSGVERLAAALRDRELVESGELPDRSESDLHDFLIEESRLSPAQTHPISRRRVVGAPRSGGA